MVMSHDYQPNSQALFFSMLHAFLHVYAKKIESLEMRLHDSAI